MKMIAVIPARYGSSRFPGKPLAEILGKPMIQWVYENVKKVNKIEEVYVATDDIRIYDKVISFGGKALMTRKDHMCGVDRIIECVELLNLDDSDLVLNIQGDEPLINPEMIEELIEMFNDETVYMGTLKKKITIESELNNTNVVKVITNVQGYAIYFSRYCIPFQRDTYECAHFKHIGVYGYKAWLLRKYQGFTSSDIERSESLEQLRVIDNGYKIKVKETMYQTIGVDTVEQLELVRGEMKNRCENKCNSEQHISK